jgi:precorrin-4 methylase
LAIFLAAARVHEVAAELEEAGVAPETPAAVVYRATWPDELVFRTTVGELVETVRSAKITRQALILVGDALDFHGGARSHLYEPGYTHLFRRGTRAG